MDPPDYHRFILLLYFCNSSTSVDMQLIFRKERPFIEMFQIKKGSDIIKLGAWCLMPNHFHILIKESVEGGISLFMKKLSTGYAMYFNKKYKRSGVLFQGNFKSEHANTDKYLKYLYSYIHLNPVKLIPGESKWKQLGIKNLKLAEKFLIGYEYSSLNAYISKPKNIYSSIIDKKQFPDYFPDQASVKKELVEWFQFAKDGPSQV